LGQQAQEDCAGYSGTSERTREVERAASGGGTFRIVPAPLGQFPPQYDLRPIPARAQLRKILAGELSLTAACPSAQPIPDLLLVAGQPLAFAKQPYFYQILAVRLHEKQATSREVQDGGLDLRVGDPSLDEGAGDGRSQVTGRSQGRQ